MQRANALAASNREDLPPAVRAAAQASLNQTDLVLGLQDARARKAAKKAQATAPAESAPAAEATVTETADERVARLVEEKLAAINAPSPSELAEAEEKRVEQLVQEALTREKQNLATQGAGPSHRSQSRPGGTGCDGCGPQVAPAGLPILTCFSRPM